MKTMMKLAMSMVAVTGMVGVAGAKGPGAGAPAPVMVAPMPPKPPTPMPMATPDPELIKAGAAMAGTWKCKGSMQQMDGSAAPMTGTDKITVDLDKWWIHDAFTAPMGKGSFHFESFTTYDATSKLWKRVMLMNDGDWMTGTAKSDPQKQDWELAVDGPHGTGMFRDHVDTSDMKTGVKMWGEVSTDKGKTWMKVYEQTCKK